MLCCPNNADQGPFDEWFEQRKRQSEGRSDDNTSNIHADHMADAGEGIMQCSITLRRQS